MATMNKPAYAAIQVLHGSVSILMAANLLDGPFPFDAHVAWHQTPTWAASVESRVGRMCMHLRCLQARACLELRLDAGVILLLFSC